LLQRLHRGLDGRKGDRLAPGQGRPQGVLHGGLAFLRRQLQDLEVLPRGPFLGMLPAERVVGHAKAARGEQVLVVLVVGEGARLADQRVDDVPVVDGVLARARQARHPLHEDVSAPHLHFLDAKHHVHLVADQTAVDRIHVPQHPDRAGHAHGDVAQAPRAFQPSRRQGTDHGLFFQELFLPPRVAGIDQLAEEPRVLLAVGEVAAAPQPQGLVHRVLEVPVRRFRVAVLVRLADVDPLPFQAVVFQQLAVSLVEFPLVAKVVHCRRQTVAAVPAGNPAQLPQGVLQTRAEGLKRFRRAERDRFPIRVRQREVIRQVRKRLAAESHAQRVHVGEVGGRQVAGMMDLRKHDLLPRTLRRPPEADPALESSPLAVRELPRGLALQPAKQRHRPQFGLCLELLLDLPPYRGVGIGAGPPPARNHALRGQPLNRPVLACRLFVHARLPCREGQTSSRGQ